MHHLKSKELNKRSLIYCRNLRKKYFLSVQNAKKKIVIKICTLPKEDQIQDPEDAKRQEGSIADRFFMLLTSYNLCWYHTPLYEYQQYWYHINFCKVHSDSHFLLTCISRHPCYCESGSSQIRSIINFVFWVWIHTGTYLAYFLI